MARTKKRPPGRFGAPQAGASPAGAPGAAAGGSQSSAAGREEASDRAARSAALRIATYDIDCAALAERCPVCGGGGVVVDTRARCEACYGSGNALAGTERNVSSERAKRFLRSNPAGSAANPVPPAAPPASGDSNRAAAPRDDVDMAGVIGPARRRRPRGSNLQRDFNVRVSERFARVRPCSENSARAIDSSKNQPKRLRCEIFRVPNQTLMYTQIVARVFKMKLDQMLKEIEVDEIFGPVAGLCYSIEYQKRGLPHAHILIIFSSATRSVPTRSTTSSRRRSLIPSRTPCCTPSSRATSSTSPAAATTGVPCA